MTIAEKIYKTYKHGGDISSYSPEQVYKSLKHNFLQVVIVMNQDFISDSPENPPALAGG